MPEYSSTTITPADGVQVPSMNGSTSGNFLLSALRDYILASKGLANGLASLGSDGKLTPSQLPDLADDVIVVASYAVLPVTGTAGKIYITADNNKMYRWDSDEADYVELSVDLSEYAKLTDLAAEETARETADANLNDAIAQHEARIENLEEAHGSYHEVDVKSVYTIPTGKGSNWIVDGLRGVSRVENRIQLTEPRGLSSSGVTVTYDSTTEKFTITGTATSNSSLWLYRFLDVVAGHKYLIGNTSANVKVYLGDVSTYGQYILADALATSTYVGVRIESGKTYNDTFELFASDLSVYFNGTIPTDADSISEIQQNYPWLLTPSDYGTSGVNTVYEGVVSIGVNIWDEEWEYGIMLGGCINSKNVIPLVYGQTYYVKTDGNAMIVVFCDSSGTELSRVVKGNGTTFVASAFYMKFIMSSDYGSTYKHDIQICLNSYTDKTTYHPYFKRTLTLPTPVSLKSAGSVADTMEPCVEVKVGDDWVDKRRDTQRVGTTEITSSTGINIWGTNVFSVSIGTTKKVPSNSTQKPNIMLAGYTTVSYADRNSEAKTITIVPTGFEYPGTCLVRDTSCTTVEQMRSAILNYIVNFELAEYVETLSDPILDNLIPTEAGGTIESILTTPVDDSMTLGYINL